MTPFLDAPSFDPRNALRLSALLTCMVALVSCGTAAQSGASLPGADTVCAPNSAQLAVGDGFQELLCGCKEPGGQVVGAGSGSTVTCTVPVGTQIFFYFIGTKLKHQMMAADGVSFPTGQLSDPSVSPMVRVNTFQLPVAGTFPYVDAYNGGITGQLVVQ